MKFRLVSFLVAATAVVFTAAPVVVQARQPNTMASNSQMLSGVNLSAQQESQLNRIRQDTRSQIERILTPTQRNQLTTSMRRDRNFRTAINSVNLSSQQKNQLQQVIQSSMRQMEAVLTPQQREQVRRNMQAQRGSQGGYQGGYQDYQGY